MITAAVSKYMSRAAGEHRADRPGPRRDRADGHERVHRHRAVAEVHERRPVEHPARPPDDGRRERERPPLPTGEVPTVDHRDDEQRQRQHRRGHQSPEHVPGFVGFGRGRLGVRHAVAEVADLLHEHRRGPTDVRVEPHRRPRGRVVDARRRDTGHLGEALLDPGRARGARHPFDREVEHSGVHAR